MYSTIRRFQKRGSVARRLGHADARRSRRCRDLGDGGVIRPSSLPRSRCMAGGLLCFGMPPALLALLVFGIAVAWSGTRSPSGASLRRSALPSPYCLASALVLHRMTSWAHSALRRSDYMQHSIAAWHTTPRPLLPAPLAAAGLSPASAPTRASRDERASDRSRSAPWRPSLRRCLAVPPSFWRSAR